MKEFGKLFLICYGIIVFVLVVFFGNLNFFGEQGFNMDIDTLGSVLILPLIPSLIISIFFYIPIALANFLTRDKNNEDEEK